MQNFFSSATCLLDMCHNLVSTGLSAVQRGALCLLDGGEFHQVSYLAVKIPLGRILRLWQRLLVDLHRSAVLACVKLFACGRR